MRCRKCGSDLPQRPGPGRPLSYCSKGCRRAAEYELRRIQSALEDVEGQIRWCRFKFNGRRPEQEPMFEAERLRLEARLRELLDDGGEERAA